MTRCVGANSQLPLELKAEASGQAMQQQDDDFGRSLGAVVKLQLKPQG